MSLVRWNPLREVEAMHNEMNRLFSRFSGMGGFDSGEAKYGNQRNGDVNTSQWLLPIDVLETPEALKLRTSLPGVDPQDVKIEVHDNVLTVSAERRYEDQQKEGSYRWIEQQYGSFARSLTLPKSADTEKIEARCHNGVLELTIPKRESAKPRRIELKTEAPIEAAHDKALGQSGGSDESRIFEANAQQASPQPVGAESVTP